jgi:hypothetical protein
LVKPFKQYAKYKMSTNNNATFACEALYTLDSDPENKIKYRFVCEVDNTPDALEQAKYMLLDSAKPSTCLTDTIANAIGHHSFSYKDEWVTFTRLPNSATSNS